MSKRVRFTADYDYVGSSQWLVAYKKGQDLSVPDAHAEAAVAAGKALLVAVATAAAPTAKAADKPAP